MRVKGTVRVGLLSGLGNVQGLGPRVYLFLGCISLGMALSRDCGQVTRGQGGSHPREPQSQGVLGSTHLTQGHHL